MFGVEIVDMMLQIKVPIVASEACTKSTGVGYFEDDIASRADDLA
jgi:hypothetical protein